MSSAHASSIALRLPVDPALRHLDAATSSSGPPVPAPHVSAPSSSASRAPAPYYVTLGQPLSLSPNLTASPSSSQPVRYRRPILITTRAISGQGQSCSNIGPNLNHNDLDEPDSMGRHNDSQEFRTSFGRGGAGNLRRVSEAQHAHSLLLKMRRNSADVDPVAVARATPGTPAHFRFHHQQSQQQQPQQRRKSSSVSSSMSSMSSLFETLRRRVSSASSLSSLGHPSSSRRHDSDAAPDSSSGVSKRQRASSSFVVGDDDDAAGVSPSGTQQDHHQHDHVDVDVNADGVKLSAAPSSSSAFPQPSPSALTSSTTNTD